MKLEIEALELDVNYGFNVNYGFSYQNNYPWLMVIALLLKNLQWKKT